VTRTLVEGPLGAKAPSGPKLKEFKTEIATHSRALDTHVDTILKAAAAAPGVRVSTFMSSHLHHFNGMKTLIEKLKASANTG